MEKPNIRTTLQVPRAQSPLEMGRISYDRPRPFPKSRKGTAVSINPGPVQVPPDEFGPNGTRETSIWDVYNNEARIVDKELIKDWTNSLNFLLLFAAIFAAVVTAFIIESKRLLEEDHEEVMRNILLTISVQLSNSSAPTYLHHDFQPEQYAIVVNCLFYASLTCSIVAALASVIALQWVGEYDAGLSRGTSPKTRAMRRHFRFAGVKRWKMGEVIAALPVLLYVTVGLFFIGLVQWMLKLRPEVGWVVVAAGALAVGFYLLTTMLAIFSPSVPFRTPVSKIPLYISGLLFNNQIFGSHKRSPVGMVREADAIGKEPNLEVELFVWITTQISLSPDFHHRLYLLIQHGLTLSGYQFMESLPWGNILEAFASPYLSLDARKDLYFSENIRDLHLLAQYRRNDHISSLKMKDHGTIGDFLDNIFEDLPSLATANDIELELIVQMAHWRISSNPFGQMHIWRQICSSRDDNDSQFSSSIFLHQALQFLCKYMFRENSDIEVLEYLSLMASACTPQSLLNKQGIISDTLLLDIIYATYRVIMGPDRPPYTFDRRPSCFKDIRNGWEVTLQPLLPNAPPEVHQMHHAIILQYALRLGQNVAKEEEQQRVYDLCRVISIIPSIDPEEVQSTSHPYRVVDDIMRDFQSRLHFTKNSIERILLDQFLATLWVDKIHLVPRIHEILACILRSKQIHPDLAPLWRFDGSSERLISRLEKRYQMNYNNHTPFFYFSVKGSLGLEPSLPPDARSAFEAAEKDRRSLEAFITFDEILEHASNPKQRFIIIRLLLEELAPFENEDPSLRAQYYTNEKKQELKEISDPCLLLIASAIAGFDYPSVVPAANDPIWKDPAWQEAAAFYLRSSKESTLSEPSKWARGILQQPTQTRDHFIFKSLSSLSLLKEVMDSTMTLQLWPQFTHGGDQVFPLLYRATRLDPNFRPNLTTQGRHVVLHLFLFQSNFLNLFKMPNLSEPCRTLILEQCIDARTNVERVMSIVEEVLRVLCEHSSSQSRSGVPTDYTSGLNCLSDIETCLEIVRRLDISKDPPVKSNRLASAFELVMKSPPTQLQQFRDASIFLPGNDTDGVIRFHRLVPELTKTIDQLKESGAVNTHDGVTDETQDTVLVMGAPARSNLTRREKIRRHVLVTRSTLGLDDEKT